MTYAKDTNATGLHQSVAGAAEGVDGASGEDGRGHPPARPSRRGALSTSGKAKRQDNQGLEAGLSFIGLVLENGERLISGYWAAYEQASTSPSGRFRRSSTPIATV